jgi:dipeptidyl-peptidase-4
MSSSAKKKLTTERIHGGPSLSGIGINQVYWSPDSKLLTYLCDSDGRRQIWAYEVSTRTKRLLCDSAEWGSSDWANDPSLMPTRRVYTSAEVKLLADPDSEYAPWRIRLVEVGPMDILNYEWSPNGKHWLLAESFLGPYVLYDVATRERSAPLPIPSLAEDVHFSNDGRWISYMLDYNLYVLDLFTNETSALTNGGTEELRFATGRTYGDFLSEGYWWSPDSTRIACLFSDVRRVRQMPVQDLTSKDLGFLSPMERFAHPGQDVPATALFVLNAGMKIWIDTRPWPDYYIASITWMPDSRRLALQLLSRNQDHLVLIIADTITGECHPVLEEFDKAWLNRCDDLTFVGNGDVFLWSSERDSYRHYYFYSLDGRQLAQLTSGDYACVQLKGLDVTNQVVYFKGFPAPYVDGHLMRVRYEIGSQGFRASPVEMLTRFPGDHPVTLSPDFAYFADLYQTALAPPRLDVYRSDGTFVETVQDNVVNELSDYLQPIEFFQINAARIGDPSDDLPLCARMIRPSNMQKGKKYPVIVYVYGGPGAGGRFRTVVNTWWHVPDLWLQMMASQGYVIFSVDNRGSCEGPRGHAFETPIFKKLGVVELADQMEGVKYLKSQPFVDPSRIGIIGGSFGGYMVLNAMLRTPGVFKVGVSIAPVSNWQGYDNIYTEQYMKLPTQNDVGYKETQLPPLAGNLEGKLLLIHGSADVNVHLHHTFNVVQQLVANGKNFELMVYPGKGHATLFETGEGGRQLYVRTMDFFRNWL